jgi:hypothetical protein
MKVLLRSTPKLALIGCFIGVVLAACSSGGPTSEKEIAVAFVKQFARYKVYLPTLQSQCLAGDFAKADLDPEVLRREKLWVALGDAKQTIAAASIDRCLKPGVALRRFAQGLQRFPKRQVDCVEKKFFQKNTVGDILLDRNEGGSAFAEAATRCLSNSP